MAKFRTEICVTPKDFQIILSWYDEREYWLGREFLAKLDGYPLSLRKNDPYYLEWYYLSKGQFDQLLDFRKELRDKRKHKNRLT